MYVFVPTFFSNFFTEAENSKEFKKAILHEYSQHQCGAYSINAYFMNDEKHIITGTRKRKNREKEESQEEKKERNERTKERRGNKEQREPRERKKEKS